ncbi:polysaccharide deacetylase family protein [Paenibacillus lacisoli]
MRGRKWGTIVAGVSAALVIGYFGGVREYANSVRTAQGDVVPTVLLQAESGVQEQSKNEALLASIQNEAAKRRIEPVDAVVDRVWKAIPGYNGREVDVEATYRQAVEKAVKAGEPISYIYREIEPKTSLKDLGAEPTYRGNPKKPMVSLMINVAWGNEYIEPMLNVLDREQVKATFFLDGSWLRKYPEIAKQIQSRGHEMENHAYSHPNMSRVSRSRAVQEIQKTQQLLKDTLGVDNKWFAPPSGDFNQATVDIAAELGLRTVLWTLDTVDWKHPDPSSVVAKIAKGVEPGSLILMHPTDSSSAALRGMIDAIKKKGLKLGTVSETLSSARVEASAVE